MSSKIISTLHLRFQSPKSQFPRRISFNSQFVTTRKHYKTRIEALHAPETLYERLGIAESCSSLSDIKEAYKKMARKYHPDVSPPERVEEYTQRFIMVHEAYETLSDPQTKALYDRDLALGFPFSSTNSNQEKEEWQSNWQSQLEQLRQRDCGGTSWGARMRNSSLSSTHSLD